MIREEAIEFGNMWLQMNEDNKDSNTYVFFQMAIKALEQEPITKNNTADFNKINELADFAIKATGQRDSYSQGMCNGIEYLRASLTDTKPKYFDSNDEYKKPKSEWEQDHAILKAYSDGQKEILDKLRAEMKPYTDPKGFIVIGENRFNMILDRCKAESEDR